MSRLALIAGPFVLGACVAAMPTRPRVDAGADVKLGEAFELRVGQTADVAGEALSVTFERVVEDSRCPVDVTCVWAGDAVLRIRLRANAESAALDVHTHANFEREGRFRSYYARLVRVEPARRSDAEIPPEKYVATFIVRKG